MSEPVKKVLDLALKLPPSQRATVAAELIASLDGEPDIDAEKAWAFEVERRIEHVRAGEGKGRPWSEVRDSLKRDPE